MNQLQKFNRLAGREKLLFLQTMLVLASVTLGLRAVPWLKLQRLLLKMANWHARSVGRRRVSLVSISRSIRAARQYIPKATCLPQALTAQHLLIWNSYPADFQIGVAKDANGRLEAHAWVTSQNKIIVGGERTANRFVSLPAIGGKAVMTMEDSFELSFSALKPEVRLLLCCARMQLDAGMAEQIHGLLKERIDWDTLRRLAYNHDVAALLYRSLESVSTSAMPAAVRADLKRQMQLDVQGNLTLTRELLRVKALFDKERIAMIPYKGPVLAASVYHDLAARPFTDLDILIHADDVPKTVELLTSHGYQIIRPKSLTQARQNLQPLWLQQLVKRSPWTYQIVLWHPDLEALVEIHWRVMSKYIFSSNAEQLWENLLPISLAGSSLPSLSPENLLWFLCVHASKHRWERLRWLCDIAELIRTYPQLDWNRITQQAIHLKIQRRLYIGLLLANRLLGAPLPAAIEEKINQASQLKILAQHVIDGLFEESKQTYRFLDIPELRFQLNSMDRLTDRFRYFLRYFNALETVVTTERMLVKPFSFLSLSSPLLRLFE